MTHKKVLATIFGTVVLAAFSITSALSNNPVPTDGKKSNLTPNITKGAQVFRARCTLCHGKQGLGEGPLPLLLEEYPSTNLMNLKNLYLERIRTAVAFGLERSDLSHYSPPFGDELTWLELESVVSFVSYLHSNHTDAIAILDKYSPPEQVSINSGRTIFRTQCVLCHGKTGNGDGRLAKVINSPPPANLTLSRLNDKDLFNIVAHGGNAIGRSSKMPPWQQQLTAAELESVILYVKSIRD